MQNIPQAPDKLISDVTEYGFSFLIIVGIWLGYTRVVSILPVETAGTIFLNLVLLFCVTMEPFLYYVLFQATAVDFIDFSSAAYGLDTGLMMALLSCMMYLVVRQEKQETVHRLRPRGLKAFRTAMFSQAIGAALFLASSLEIFWVPLPVVGYLRFLMWYMALGVFFASRAFVRRG